MIDLTKTIDLSTTYLGLKLKNPLVASSSPMCREVGNIRRLELTAVCDPDPAKLARYPQLAAFFSADAMIASGRIDAILVATPHYDHTTVGIQALEAGRSPLLLTGRTDHLALCRLTSASRRPRAAKTVNL